MDNSHRLRGNAAQTPPSVREARTPTAPAGHLLAAPRWCAACRHGIAADKGNSLVRHARTAHRAAAHYAWLTLKEGGKNSHRRGFSAPPPSVREASYNHSRKEGFPPPAHHICAYLRLRRKSECGALLCCDCAAERKHAVSRRACPRVVSQNHDFFPRQFAENSVNKYYA